MSDWKPLDTQKAVEKQRRQSESTTSAGVGGFAVPLGGGPLRPPMPTPPYKTLKSSKRKPKKSKI